MFWRCTSKATLRPCQTPVLSLCRRRGYALFRPVSYKTPQMGTAVFVHSHLASEVGTFLSLRAALPPCPAVSFIEPMIVEHEMLLVFFTDIYTFLDSCSHRFNNLVELNFHLCDLLDGSVMWWWTRLYSGGLNLVKLVRFVMSRIGCRGWPAMKIRH